MPRWPNTLLTPEHVFQARSPEELVGLVRLHAENGRAKHPALIWSDPWPSVAKPAVYVNCGRWMISCATPGCCDCPIVHPAWRVAVCFECGAVYTKLSIPTHAKVIEAVLVQRPNPWNRNWAASEPLAELIAENYTHNVPTGLFRE